MATNWNEWFGREHPPALSKIWVLESTWTDLTVELQKLIEILWRYSELGNDHYIFKTSIEGLERMIGEGFEGEVWYWGETEEEKRGWVTEPVDLTPLVTYLKDHGIRSDDPVWIHHWW